MNLTTVTSVKRPTSADEVPSWNPGYAWLAGGTWLFSEPQIATDTLIDLVGLRWPALSVSDDGLEIGATCRIVDLDRFVPPPHWRAGPLLRECCRSFLASFKIWNAATVGGNVCMSLPAGPMISLVTALDGVCTLWPREGEPRQVAAVDFVTGNHQNVLQPGELLRSIRLPAASLARRYAFRRSSLTHLGRSSVLLIGTAADTGETSITITAATVRPIQLRFARVPEAHELQHAIDANISEELYLHDVHGSPPYRKRMTHYFAEQIRAELASQP